MQLFTIVLSAQTAYPVAQAMMNGVASDLRSLIAAGSITVSSLMYRSR